MDTLLAVNIAQDIQDRGIATMATDLFVGQLPATVESGMFVVAASSPQPHLYLDTEEQVFDFWYRSDYTDLAYTKLRDVYNLYHRRANYPMGSWYVYFSHAMNGIMDMDRERESGKLFKVSILFECRNISNIS